MQFIVLRQVDAIINSHARSAEVAVERPGLAVRP
jgi:hypothetical protein